MADKWEIEYYGQYSREWRKSSEAAARWPELYTKARAQLAIDDTRERMPGNQYRMVKVTETRIVEKEEIPPVTITFSVTKDSGEFYKLTPLAAPSPKYSLNYYTTEAELKLFREAQSRAVS